MKNNNNQSLNESDMEQWRRGKISTQELQKRQALQPVPVELAIPGIPQAARGLGALAARTAAAFRGGSGRQPDRSQEPSLNPGSITPRPGRQEPELNLPSNDSPALSNMTAQLVKKNEPESFTSLWKPTPRGPGYRSADDNIQNQPQIWKPTPRGPGRAQPAPFGKPHIVPRPGETPQQAIDRIQKAATGQSKLEEFEKNLQQVTNEYQKFKEQVGKPTFQATDAQLNDPNWMRARGLVPMQDIEASVKSADAQNKALASAADAGFPTYQYQGQTYGVKNPAYGKGGTSSQPQPLSPQQIQQTAGTNIVSGSGAPVTSGSKMAGPNAAGTSSGSLSNLQENPYRRLIDIIDSTEKRCPPATQHIDS